ncbi:MAG: hypothetical protein P4L68_10605 [Methylovirgula sp.]|nr:hypothetical protein [Methylovirgula sp.]
MGAKITFRAKALAIPLPAGAGMPVPAIRRNNTLGNAKPEPSARAHPQAERSIIAPNMAVLGFGGIGGENSGPPRTGPI